MYAAGQAFGELKADVMVDPDRSIRIEQYAEHLS